MEDLVTIHKAVADDMILNIKNLEEENKALKQKLASILKNLLDEPLIEDEKFEVIKDYR